MSNLKLFLIITATFILQVANCQRPMLSLRTFFLTFFPKSCDRQVEKLVNENTFALGMNNRAIIPCIPKLWLCYIVSKLFFFFWQSLLQQVVYLTISFIFPVFWAIAAITPSLAYHPLLFHEQSKLTPVHVVSLLLLLIANWVYFFLSHFHIAISNFTGCFN